MKQSEKKSRLTPRQKDLLWHGVKSLICLSQLYFLTSSVQLTVASIAASVVEEYASVPFLGLLFAAQFAVFMALWIYYDRNDDRAFDRFCEPEEPPKLLRDPAYRLGIGLTVVGCGGIFLVSLYPLARTLLPLLPPAPALLIAFVVGSGVALLASVLRLRRLNYVWGIQKTLRRPTDKRLSIKKRIFYAVIFYISLAFGAVGLAVLIPMLLSLVIALLILALKPVIFIGFVLVALLIVNLLRRVLDRRKFFKRLERLRDKGELSFTVHGHPYLSLFFRRVHFSMTVVDMPHRDSRDQTVRTYQVAVAHCNRRRMVVVLCENNIFQFMYAFNIRVLGHVSTLGMAGKLLSIPIVSFFISHEFEFPKNETEGKRILLVDPAPFNLCMRGFREGELIVLDNASEQYGYTVYGKNSFVSMLERM